MDIHKSMDDRGHIQKTRTSIHGYLLFTDNHSRMSLHGYPDLDINVDIYTYIDD